MTDPTTDPTPPAEGFPETAPGEIVTAVELERTTLADLGQVLPASRLPYKFHRPNVGTMRRLGQLQADVKLQRRPGRFVTIYLAAALAELGGDDLGPVGRNDKAATKIAQLPAGDVLTLLVAWTHAQHARKGVNFGVGGCGACGSEWPAIRVNLGDLEVLALPYGEASPVARVGLWTGFQVHGQDVAAVLVAPPTWGGSLGGLSKEGWANPVAIRAATLQGAIRACDAFPKLGRLGLEALDELMPEDVELLDDALGQITASVSLEVGIDCPDCGATNVAALDWKNLGFSNGPAGP